MSARVADVLDGLESLLSGGESIGDGDLAELLQQWTAALVEDCQRRLQGAAEPLAASSPERGY
jgi:hypothetical protein